jgi:hypothetical protein
VGEIAAIEMPASAAGSTGFFHVRQILRTVLAAARLYAGSDFGDRLADSHRLRS